MERDRTFEGDKDGLPLDLAAPEQGTRLREAVAQQDPGG